MFRIGGKEIHTVCIIGAGNEGHYFMAYLGDNKGLNVNVLTSRANGFDKYIESLNVQTGEIVIGVLNRVSSDPSEVIPESDMIIFTVPSNIYQQELDLIFPYVTDGTILGFIPGTGGVEFLSQRFIKEKHCYIFGSQRVPSGTKVAVRGKRVNALEKRRDIRIASIPNRINADVCSFINSIFGIPTVKLPNYLSVTFTPSNPILHTSRLYGLFHDYKEGDGWDHVLSFYKEWSPLSSEMLLGCNKELQECCKALKEFDLSWVSSLVDHYEIWTAPGDTDIERMTNKIQSLIYMKDNAPMCLDGRGFYIPDFKTRYFTEDFPFGLAILKDFCHVCEIDTPYMDTVLSWYDKLCGADLYVNGEFCGSGRLRLPLPSTQGLNTRKDLIGYYKSLDCGLS